MAEEDDGLISFKWNNHKNTFFHVLTTLRCKETYTDATLACEGKFFPVHKLVMSTCSDYFGEVFEKAACKSPVVILKDMRQQDLEALLDYMYLGEVDVKQSELSELLRAAECLRIKGLAVPDYLSYATPTKNYVETCHTNDSSQSYHDESDSMTSHNDGSDSSPPAKRCKKDDEQQSKGFIEDSDHLKNSNLPSPSNVNFAGEHLQLLTTSAPLPVALSAPTPMERKRTSNMTQLTLPVTPTKPRSLSQRRRISVRTPQSSKLTKAIKIIKKTKKTKSRRKITKSEGPSSALPHNHRDYYFIHEERSGSGDKVNSEHGALTNHGNSSTATSGAVPQRRRRKRGTAKLTGSNLIAEKVKPSLLLSANLANLQEKDEPIIAPEEFCDRIGLPQFSSTVIPILEGQELSANDKHKLANGVIEQLVCHFRANHVSAFMCNRPLRSKFYMTIQTNIMEKYPNNTLEDDSLRKGKKGKKGPLGATIGKVAERINRRVRLQRNKEQGVSRSTTLNPTTSASQPSNSKQNGEAKERKKLTYVTNVEKRKKMEVKQEQKQVEKMSKRDETEEHEIEGEINCEKAEEKKSHDQVMSEGSHERIAEASREEVGEGSHDPVEEEESHDQVKGEVSPDQVEGGGSHDQVEGEGSHDQVEQRIRDLTEGKKTLDSVEGQRSPNQVERESEEQN